MLVIEEAKLPPPIPASVRDQPRTSPNDVPGSITAERRDASARAGSPAETIVQFRPPKPGDGEGVRHPHHAPRPASPRTISRNFPAGVDARTPGP
ncbi:hypothetical protein SVIOM342S_00300 [Streptomyces violaceorubidus]